jgi:thioredoxin 1
MQLEEYRNMIEKAELPLVVEFSAEWCGPCRAMAPHLHQVESQFAGRVTLVQVNADESADVLKELGVMGIPTIIGYAQSKPVARQTGYMDAAALTTFFAAVESGQAPVFQRSLFSRLLFLAAGAALIVAGATSGPSWVLIILGIVAAFGAVWDRCPIIAAIRRKMFKAEE